MPEIATRADMKLDAKIQYKIDSVLDDESSKSVLYLCIDDKKEISLLRKIEDQQRQVMKITKMQSNNKTKHSRQMQINEKPKNVLTVKTKTM